MALIGDSTSIWWLHAAAVGLQSADSAESASNYCTLLQTIYQFFFRFFVLSGSTVYTMVGYFICLFLMKKGNGEGKLKQLQNQK